MAGNGIRAGMLVLPLVALLITGNAGGVLQAQDSAQSQDVAQFVAQEDAADSATAVRQASIAQQHWVDELKQMQVRLAATGAWQLRLQVQTGIAGESEKAAVMHLVLRVNNSEASKQIQLDFFHEDQKDSVFQVRWDGRRILRAYRPEKLFSIQPSQDLRQNLRDCSFTADTLLAAHADFLLQPDPVEHLSQQVVHLQEWVKEGQGDAASHRYLMELIDGRQVQLEFENGLPAKLESHQISRQSQEQQMDLTTTCQFQWNLDQLPEAEPAISTEGWKEVGDLKAAFLGDDVVNVDRLPQVEVEITADESSSLQQQLKGRPALLYFWATWAAPSLREMDGVKQFANQVAESGVGVHPINVGQQWDQVQEFLKSKEITLQSWRDPKGEVARQLGVTTLPAVVVVDPEGKIVKIWNHVSEADRPAIRQQLSSLLPTR